MCYILSLGGSILVLTQIVLFEISWDPGSGVTLYRIQKLNETYLGQVDVWLEFYMEVTTPLKGSNAHHFPSLLEGIICLIFSNFSGDIFCILH
jgi:hypothetical protein